MHRHFESFLNVRTYFTSKALNFAKLIRALQKESDMKVLYFENSRRPPTSHHSPTYRLIQSKQSKVLFQPVYLHKGVNKLWASVGVSFSRQMSPKSLIS